MTGLVIKNTGSWYTVLTDDGQTVDCKIKGNFRLKGIRSTNPVAVGDRVAIVPTPSPSPREGRLHDFAKGKDFLSPSRGEGIGVGLISAIEDRRNYIIRKSSNLSKQSHILAANVDQAFLVVTVTFPETSTTFIDRFLASAEAYSVPVVLVFNKIDRLDDENKAVLEAMMRLYEAIGYECRAISAATGDGVEELRPLLQGKITLLAGNSGVGKSTLINRLIPDAKLRTAEISDAHNTGMHTTTFSEMLRLPSAYSEGRGSVDSVKTPPLFGGGWEGALIDTPGIKGFGTFDMEPEELTSYFREIFHFSEECKFSNCTHTHEPGCAVLKALDNHLIAPSRYQSYLSMMEDKDEDKYRAAY